MNDQEAWNSMVEGRTDDQIFAEMKMAEQKNQPQATDFTEIVASVTAPRRTLLGGDGLYSVKVLLDSGQQIIVSKWVCQKEAERVELAINQAMIEFRTKRNAWEADFKRPE